MIWGKDISTIEIILISIFAISYAYYFFKVGRLSKKLDLSMRSTAIKFILRVLYFGLIVAAVLGPSFGITEMEARTAGKDVFLCVDLSQSMNATDVSPSRIEKVKAELSQMVEGIRENRIGLIIFSEQAFIQIPLTFDTDVIKYGIAKLNTQILARKGTNINAPIALSIEKLTEEGAAKDRDKVAIIFTDGEDFGTIDQALLKKNSINLIFVGVGTETGSEVVGKNGVFIDDENGNQAITKVNQKGLNTLASMTNGKSFQLNNNVDPTKDILAHIDELRSGVLKERTVVVANNKYLYFLLPALFLVLIDAIFVVKIFKL